MKRQTAMALAAVFAMSVAGTALAAPANPFVDVPAKHWSYDAVTKLAQAGVVSGYGDGTYKGDKTMTRYEMATIIAKAMANSEKADAETQKTIDALAAEYGAELNNLGVRVDNLEKKIGNVKFSGEMRARYDHNELKFNGTELNKDMTQFMRMRLNVNAQVNEDWAFVGRFASEEDLRSSGADNDNKMDHLYMTGKAGAFDVTVGRFDVTPAYGIALDDTVEGAMVSFGNKLRVDLFAGKQEYTEILTDSQKDELYIANLSYALSDKLNVKGAYFHVKPEGFDKINLYEVGLDYQFTPTVNVSGVYLKSDFDLIDNQDKGFFTQLSYKGSDIANKGSFGAWVNYRDLEVGTVLSSTLDVAAVSVADVPFGGKGYEVGFDYVVKKNMLWTTTYTDLEGTVDNNLKEKFFRTQMEFFF
ncbi:S-layer homology domain-containing protein [Sporomusa sphaeroides]|uniref:S-layer homology domain-containing protein n=1 Tax=Sporomusa sphaeroides TaxID=47679 RepID=UPI002C312CC8|nr:S-layer homology domain-containing protein [Sporomusa sphaeroides]HML34128.1 S-layer homology domain-containing protein [Sporomusa sphaeroides]